MAGDNPAANPTGGNQQVDTAAITAAVNAALAASLKPITDAIGTLTQGQQTLAQSLAAQTTPANKTGAAGADAAKTLTAEDVTRLVKDGITQAMTTQQQTQQQQQQRQAFITTRLKNLPEAYQSRLGSDPAKWEDEAKQIAEGFKADATKFGWKVPDVGGDQPGGQSPAAAKPDLSKLSPGELIRQGLQQSKPGSGTAATAAAAVTSAPAVR